LDAAGVGQAVPGRRQRALHVVDPLADHHLDRVGALAEDHDLDGLAVFHSQLYFLVVHSALPSVWSAWQDVPNHSGTATAAAMKDRLNTMPAISTAVRGPRSSVPRPENKPTTASRPPRISE